MASLGLGEIANRAGQRVGNLVDCLRVHATVLAAIEKCVKYINTAAANRSPLENCEMKLEKRRLKAKLAPISGG
jgi:hypothetical protein